ncbi:MAG: APC family permease [Streptomycetaceae bacterium]|nr:MAG: APC family permease [Streptomycetaceae bacterium]
MEKKLKPNEADITNFLSRGCITNQLGKEYAITKEGPNLTTRRVVFLVIAAAAPMAAMVGNVPLALLYGNGGGLPAAFLLATLVLICFSVGYAAMSRKVINTGAFYTYIARSLTKPVGVGSAYVALAAYTAQACGLAGAFGYFMQQLVLAAVAIDIPWYVFTAIGILLVAILGYRSVEMSAKVVGFFMIAEFAILFVFEGLVLNKKHFESFPLASFSHSQISSGPIGIAMLFAFTSFIGFESAALYGEETKDPEKSIPRATYLAVSSVGIFYILSTWIIIGSVGIDNVRTLSKKDGGLFVLNLVQQYGGEILFDVTAVLLCTSVLAGYSAIHNAASRYLFALGRESIMPKRFGQHHKHYFSPHIASVAITVVAVVTAVGFAISGVDPYTVYAASLIAVGTLGIVALQAMASLSVVAFFWRRPDRQLWQGVIAPIIGFVGLVTAFFLAAMHYNTLTGTDSKTVNLVPFLLLIIAIGGILYGHRLRTTKPDVYAELASSKLR